MFLARCLGLLVALLASCGGGEGAPACPAGLIDCAGACIDPNTSRDHCGAQLDCAGDANDGQVCAAGEVCSAGACALSCQAGLVSCGGACIDPDTSRSYCGAQLDCTGDANDGAICTPGQLCQAGACVDTPTLTMISPAAGLITGGIEVTLTGMNFDPVGGMSASIGGLEATVVSVTSTTIVVTLPATTQVGLASVSVTDTYGRSATAPDGFFYYRDLTFSRLVTYDVANTVAGLAVTDLSGDAVPDIVVSSQAVFEMQTMIGAGDGTFVNQTSFAITEIPVGVGVADLDRDTFPDIVATSASGGAPLHVFLNNGDGTFPPPLLQGSGNQQRSNIVFGDVNEDGKLDVVFGGRNSNGFGSRWGNGDGTFTGGVNVGINQCADIGLADFDADYHLDVIVATGGNLVLYPGVGDGTFGAPTTIISGTTGSGRLIVRDFNRDKRPDVAVSLNGAVQILLGTGAGGFAGPIAIATPGTSPQGLDAADFNRDGTLDLIVANNDDDSASILLGTGKGTFPAIITVTGLDNPTFVAAADLDRDARIDLVINDARGAAQDGVAVLLNTTP